MLQEDGIRKVANASSVSRVKASQFAFLKFMKVRCGGSGKSIEKALPSWTIMGRWSELRVVMVRHSESMAMCGVAIVRSGEVGFPFVGSRVGESVLRSVRSESHSVEWMRSPRLAARKSEV